MTFERVAEVWRGSVIESVHFGAAAVANARGEIVHGWGDPSFTTYPRSALKPIQAISLVESGAYRAFGLTPRHLALACASHSGEEIHTELVTQWLRQLGLAEENLACGPAYPSDQETVEGLIRTGRRKTRIFNDCSGKHCGFLTVARHGGWEVSGYNDLAHPVHQRYLEVLSDLFERDAAGITFGVDGCALPAAAFPIGDMARAMARFAAAKASSAGRKAAILQIHEAARDFPEYMSGLDQPTHRLARATKGSVLMKSGAEGFVTAFAPKSGLGIALKMADGASRARIAVFMALLKELKLLDAAAQTALQDLFKVPITNSVGDRIGCIRPCSGPAEVMPASAAQG